ncbi:MAG: TetR/AcrR family transcriptional regulator [Acidimicrobiia bacterium]
MKTVSSTKSARTGRREAILDAATHLFSTRGYADTGIDDIGEAVGVTGPAVYRHFASKQDLLVATLERAVEHAASILPLVTAEALAPEASLWRLVDLTARACIEERAMAVLYWQESRNLPAEPREHFERLQRDFIEGYAEVLRGVRRDLTPSESRMAVHAAASLMRSAATRETTLDEERLHRLLSSMAYAALMGNVPA